MKYQSSIESNILVKTEEYNKFYSLSLCTSGGSLRCSLGYYRKFNNKYEVLNDIKEIIDTVDTLEDVLSVLKIDSYISFNEDYEDLYAWHKLNCHRYNDEIKDLETLLLEFNKKIPLCA